MRIGARASPPALRKPSTSSNARPDQLVGTVGVDWRDALGRSSNCVDPEPQAAWQPTVAQSGGASITGRQRAHTLQRNQSEMVAAPHGRSPTGAPGSRYAANAKSSHTRWPRADRDETTRRAPNGEFTQSACHGPAPPRRERADGQLGKRGRRHRTQCPPASSTASVTLTRERANKLRVPCGGRIARRSRRARRRRRGGDGRVRRGPGGRPRPRVGAPRPPCIRLAGYGPRRAVLLGGVSHRLPAEAQCPVIVPPRGVEAALEALMAVAPGATAAG